MPLSQQPTPSKIALKRKSDNEVGTACENVFAFFFHIVEIFAFESNPGDFCPVELGPSKNFRTHFKYFVYFLYFWGVSVQMFKIHILLLEKKHPEGSLIKIHPVCEALHFTHLLAGEVAQ